MEKLKKNDVVKVTVTGVQKYGAFVNTEDDNYHEYLELTETLKSQIAEAGRNSAKDYIAQNIAYSSEKYCREIYEALENDNPLGENREEGFKIFEKAFKDVLEQHGIDDEQNSVNDEDEQRKEEIEEDVE